MLFASRGAIMRHERRIGMAKRQGAAAVEFAIVGPVFFLLLAGMIVYGGWFWMAHSVQAAVSEGARAAIAGLDRSEEHTSELQSRENLVCRLLLENKKVEI